MPQTIQFKYTVTVENVMVPPSNISVPYAIVGVPYSYQMPQPAGGLGPYHWSAAGLPAGLTISDGGLISGTPTEASPTGSPLPQTVFTVTDSTP